LAIVRSSSSFLEFRKPIPSLPLLSHKRNIGPRNVISGKGRDDGGGELVFVFKLRMIGPTIWYYGWTQTQDGDLKSKTKQCAKIKSWD